MVPYQFQAIAGIFILLAPLALVVKYDRRIKRWLMKSPRRRKKRLRPASLQHSALPQ